MTKINDSFTVPVDAKPDRGEAAPELERLRDELHAAEQRAAEIVREFDQICYAISHDLRAPLRAIDGFSTILLEDYRDRLDDQGKHYLQVVSDNSRKLNSYVEALLDMARIGRRTLNCVVLDMDALFAAACADFTATATDRQISFQIDSLPTAVADREMIREVIVELVGNAVKFTRPRAEAVIRITGGTSGKENRYVVNDNGIGFDMQYADKLFGLFQKLHGSDSFEGEGAGLARIRRILDRQGGQVWAEGNIDAGASFFFTLPAYDPAGHWSGKDKAS